MKLEEWKNKKGISNTELSKALNITVTAVVRYLKGQRIPEANIMKRIFEFTKGRVQPNDFYDLGD